MTTVAMPTNGQKFKRYGKQQGILTFRHMAIGFLLGLFVFPSYFGINLGFDLTVLRFFEVLLLVFIVKNKRRRKDFGSLIKNCKQTKWLLIYFFIVCYTNVLRGFAINGILNTFFNWILVFYLMFYLIQYEFGVRVFLQILKKMLFFVCIVSALEYVVGFPPFSLLDTLGKSENTGISRSGSIRIAGMCTTANGFGLYLMLLLPLAAFDEAQMRIDILKNKWLVILVVLCTFMTGGRLGVGSMVLELVLLILFSQKGLRGRSFFFGTAILLVLAVFVFVFQDVSFFRSILQSFTSAIDEVFGTTYSVQYGVSAQMMYNSTFYRELLVANTFGGSWLNPLLGRGTDYFFGMYIDGYYIFSCDNFYVGQYITYAYPGLIVWLIFALSFLISMIIKAKNKSNLSCIVVIIATIGYFVSLWYLDQLQTFPVMMALFALGSVTEKGKLEKRTLGVKK